jgi:hypothetical protein
MILVNDLHILGKRLTHRASRAQFEPPHVAFRGAVVKTL